MKPKLFNPGEQIIIPEDIKEKNLTNLELICDEIEVTTQSRLASVIFDLREIMGFIEDFPKTGGLGYSADFMKTKIKITKNKEKSLIFKDKEIKEITNLYKVFSEIFKDLPGLTLEIESHELKHKGLGRTSSLSLAFSVGINEMLGNPLTNYELRKIMGFNYFEEARDNKEKLVKGHSFGSTAVTGLYGGLAVMGTGYEIIEHMPISSEFSVIAYHPHPKLFFKDKGKGLPPEDEKNGAKNFDRNAEIQKALTKYSRTLYELLPAMRKQDFIKHAEIAWELFSLQLEAIAMITGKEYIEHLKDLHNQGALCPALSSTGPLTFFYCKKDQEKFFVDYLTKNEYTIGDILIGKSDKGLTINFPDNKEKTYQFNRADFLAN
ncbi:hypothetical protein DRJ22_00900 [Candidatus Woesearchaeota archaeon]|nr:MAG: hypothetical protein B6U93_00585 [Candidatus Woesearchaeota archaeon ex4484_78]RLE46857.1 MAG: hypothetical protein DRJ22_00900 [Candidatus Woesearchaeota archaeon]